MGKLYIPVILHVNENGKVTPKQIKARLSGEWLRIDKVTDSSRRASFRAGISGIRYSCVVSYEGETKNIYLFDENGRWAIEVEGE